MTANMLQPRCNPGPPPRQARRACPPSKRYGNVGGRHNTRHVGGPCGGGVECKASAVAAQVQNALALGHAAYKEPAVPLVCTSEAHTARLAHHGLNGLILHELFCKRLIMPLIG